MNQLSRVKKLFHLFQEGGIPTLTQHEVHPGLDKSSRENYLYFTLPPCINFQRNSPAMWRSALATWNDPKTNYLFFPEKVGKTKYDKVQSDLIKHKLGLQPNKHTHIWTTICATLNKFFSNDPRELLGKGDKDVVKVINLIQKEQKEYFTHLRGPKMTNYWLYILSQYTDMKLKNMNEISIIPDTHVLQCSFHLGITKEKSTAEQVAQAWKELLSGSEITPVQMHPVLWNWSRNDFKPDV